MMEQEELVMLLILLVVVAVAVVVEMALAYEHWKHTLDDEQDVMHIAMAC